MNDRSPIRVLIADDQDMVRTGFRFFLDAQPDITVVAEAADGKTAVRLARELRPDVCLLDIRMPRLDGLEATRLLAGPGVADPLRVVVVTTFDLDEYVYGALRGGACGFLLKDSGPTLLAEAVRAAAAGDALVSPSVTVRLLRHVTAEKAEAPERKEKTGRAEKRRQEGGAGPGAPRSQEALTERELDVVRLVALGHTNAEIAASMFVSLSTVKTHLGSIQLKLAARNRVEIAAWAWRTGHAGEQG
ncbi:response regulator [Streptomyces scabiei]|uniref:response regulator n=1 Tax=Streptomyces scabiei TaxID=1930 RepID=UPI001B319D90|nr:MULTISPECIES: response regulator transcription factor [Streptomyces]MBP5889460.1 response regulator transcription factor [Streptomyces sp. LBUM 1481]MBP5919488.1 response regulator transcription factor [Streptomyces sp. LBUM 1483]MDX2690563.1 response regulator transcription factor [Streptomyces scabiei]MDX2753688.1 response regulator transcription factor [Streptomyces scabiei]MDX2809826.1 response regulator transcription factor [Streptomyces scabiei]